MNSLMDLDHEFVEVISFAGEINWIEVVVLIGIIVFTVFSILM